MDEQELYMKRAINLSRLGAGYTGANPMVGAVLVHNGRIIGEGYHRKYGEAHAEVDCLQNVKSADEHLLAESTMYVTLEPCSHFGKTPPCADLLVSKQIKKVVIGCRDPFPAVNGKGIEKMLAAGIAVQSGFLESECQELNKRFFTFHTRKRPYVILKWAQTADHFISAGGFGRLMITNDFTNRLVHKWRSEEMAIMVGTNTAMADDPSLTNRLWAGNNPVRILIDNSLKLPASLKLFNSEASTVVLNSIKDEQIGSLRYVKTNEGNLLEAIYRLDLISVIIEGGSTLLHHFIEAGTWDEARVITNQALFAGNGIVAPVLVGGRLAAMEQSGADVIRYFKKNV